MGDTSNRAHAEEVVLKWHTLLKAEGVLHGELAYSDELVDMIEEELDWKDHEIERRMNAAKENNNKTAGSETSNERGITD